MTGEIFMQQLANGISLGSLYALLAIGYTMVYGILRLINFAHGDIFMMAAYFMLFKRETYCGKLQTVITSAYKIL
jgi:branched-chain amino acid transport system permease protein